MPIVMSSPDPGIIAGLVAAAPGWRVDALAPRDTDTTGIPTPSHVVAWAMVTAPNPPIPGGATVEPVFVAANRTWTPDQYKAVYGQHITLQVVPAR